MTEVTQISDGNNVMSTNDLIDAVEYVMINEMVGSGEFVLIQAPLGHDFKDGRYVRTIIMPAGSRYTTSIHLTAHPFLILKGKVSVFSDVDGLQIIEAPYDGMTKPGTRRIIYAIEETIWATIHETDIVPENDSEEAKAKAGELVMEQITALHENVLLGGTYRNSVFIEPHSEIWDKNKIYSHVI